jgi:hypothetical protein
MQLSARRQGGIKWPEGEVILLPRSGDARRLLKQQSTNDAKYRFQIRGFDYAKMKYYGSTGSRWSDGGYDYGAGRGRRAGKSRRGHLEST